MDLHEFVKETIVQISKGIEDARTELVDADISINPVGIKLDGNSHNLTTHQHKTVSIVEYDVAITTEQKEETEGRAGLLVASIGIGGKLKMDEFQNNISRIKFSIPIRFSFTPNS